MLPTAHQHTFTNSCQLLRQNEAHLFANLLDVFAMLLFASPALHLIVAARLRQEDARSMKVVRDTEDEVFW